MVGRDYGSARYTSADLDSQIRLADDGLCFLYDEGALEASLQLDPGTMQAIAKMVMQGAELQPTLLGSLAVRAAGHPIDL